MAAIADAQPIDFSVMAAAQRSCPEVKEMMNSTTLQITTQVVGDETLLGDISTGVFRPLVPIQHREAVFQSLYAIHHPGVQATRRLIAARFCWLQMARFITLFFFLRQPWPTVAFILISFTQIHITRYYQT